MMEDDTQQFLTAMAKGADETTRDLELQEARILQHVGSERALELKRLWARELDFADEEDVKRTMDWSDKELIWIWSRLERSRERRALAGRVLMARNHGQESR